MKPLAIAKQSPAPILPFGYMVLAAVMFAAVVARALLEVRFVQIVNSQGAGSISQQMKMWPILLAQSAFWMCTGLGLWSMIAMGRRSRLLFRVLAYVMTACWSVIILFSTVMYFYIGNEFRDAIDGRTPPARLEELIHLKSGAIDERVASNPNITLSIAETLLQRTDQPRTIQGLATNPETPSDVLLQIATRFDADVARSLYLNPELPDEARSTLRRRQISPPQLFSP